MAEPLSAFYSTAINSRIDSFPKLATRNLRMLGCPLIKLEIAQDMAYEAISKAVELYTEYSEPDQEYLLFDSSLYTAGLGVRLDTLVSYTPELSSLVDPTDINSNFGRDTLLGEYRKVIDVRNMEEGTNTGTNILFSLQYSLTQQLGVLFYSGGLAKGFDLITWYAAQEFLELRNKMLALKSYTRFDQNTQILRILPEPDPAKSRYWALIEVLMEPRIKDALKSHFVQEYSLALMKIMIGNIRGKYNGVQLLGNGTMNFNDVLSQGLATKEKLENDLLNGTGGFVSGAPPTFLVY